MVVRAIRIDPTEALREKEQTSGERERVERAEETLEREREGGGERVASEGRGVSELKLDVRAGEEDAVSESRGGSDTICPFPCRSPSGDPR